MNLIICCTPLQVLIAEKIIEKFPQQSFYGVMLTTVENTKMAFYRERLKQKCSSFFAMLQHSDRLNLLKEILRLKRHFAGKTFEQVFVANINDLQIQFLLSAIQFEGLNTFDDGTINLVPNGLLAGDDALSRKRFWINKLLGNHFSIKTLREISQRHYSIYKDMPNIIERVEYIDLIPALEVQKDAQAPISILLGQPIFSQDERNIALANRVIKQFNIQQYLPHPREKYCLNDVEYIETPLIFEDYIFQQSQQRKYRVYAYFSSALLNVMNKSENIEVIALEVDTENAFHQACYDLFRQAHLPVIDIRDK